MAAQVPVNPPTIQDFPGDHGGMGVVVGADPWGDLDDATYASAWTRKDLTTNFQHILATIPPVAIDPATVTISLRISATASMANTFMKVNAVINLYPPGSPYGGVEPPLNLADGISASHVKLPTYDGTIYDIPVSFYDWNYEVPASAAQVAAYFADGGTILVQPNITGGGNGTAEVKIHRLAFVADLLAGSEPYRRTFPRDDGLAGGAGRNWPRPRSAQSSNRTSGYL